MDIKEKTESQWKREGHTEEEIRAFSVIGLVLCDPEPCTPADERDEAVAALRELFDDYKQLADSGDAGRWRLEDTAAGKRALAVLEKLERLP